MTMIRSHNIILHSNEIIIDINNQIVPKIRKLPDSKWSCERERERAERMG